MIKWSPRSSFYGNDHHKEKVKLQESDKGQIFYWSIQTCSRIRLLFDWLSIVTMLKKPQNCPISDFFNLTPKYFLPLLPYTDLVPPSTDPVPPSTNQYRPILTHYHHKPTSTAQYCPSTTKYQPTPPHTDPLPPQTNQYCPILTKHHQAPFIIISSFRLPSDS